MSIISAPTIRELLDGRISSSVEEMRTIRGKTRLSWRILREVNRTVLSVPERLSFEAYHVILDVDFGGVGGTLKNRIASPTVPA